MNLVRAMTEAFPSAEQLRCFNHMRRNIKTKLVRDIKLTPAVSEDILCDIFGRRVEDQLVSGLVNASDESAFQEQLLSLECKWNTLEEKHGSPKDKPGFFLWFTKYCSNTIVKNMLKTRSCESRFRTRCKNKSTALLYQQ